MKQIIKVNINLYILYQTLVAIDLFSYPDDVRKKLLDLQNYICQLIFGSPDPDFECLEQEWYCVDTLEKIKD